MAIRFVRPDTTRIPLSDGEWIEVKKKLSAGEERAQLARIYIAGVNGELKANPMQVGLALMVSYLVDWSGRDENGKPVNIRDLAPDVLAKVLDDLEPSTFGEIRKAIEAHAEAMDVEKNVPDGGNELPAISPSPAGVAGVTSGSVN